MSKKIKQANEQLVLLNDSLSSLGDNIKNIFIASNKSSDSVTDSIQKSLLGDIKGAEKALKGQEMIIEGINKSKNKSAAIDTAMIKNEAVKLTILRKAEVLRRNGKVQDEESLLLAITELDKVGESLKVLKEKNLEKQKERDYLKEGVKKLKEQYTLTRLTQATMLLVGESILDASGMVANIAQNTGLSAENSQKMQLNFANIANHSGEVFINSKRLNASFAALSKQTGLIAGFSGDTLVAFTQLTEQLGMGVEQATQLTLMSKLQGGNVEGIFNNVTSTVNAINRQNGVSISAKTIFDDISNASKAIVVSLGMNPVLLADAATKARLLGSELSKIDAIAGNVLDFESSINAELQAELFTGKQLNFEKIRLLALNNDLAGVSNELLENEEMFSAFSEGNRLTQQALADSIGISRDEMADMVMSQKFLQLGAEGFTAEFGEQSYQQMLQLSASQKLEESFTKLKTGVMDMVMPMIPFVDALASSLSMLASMPALLLPISAILTGMALRAFLISIAFNPVAATAMAVLGSGILGVQAYNNNQKSDSSPSSNVGGIDYDKMASAMSRVQVVNKVDSYATSKSTAYNGTQQSNNKLNTSFP